MSGERPLPLRGRGRGRHGNSASPSPDPHYSQHDDRGQSSKTDTADSTAHKETSTK